MAIALVLTGGRATRFGGVDKTLAEIAGIPSRDRVLAACIGHRRILVGPETPDHPLPQDVLRLQEDPPYAGPVAGVACAQEYFGNEDTVLLLGGDMPLIASKVLDSLLPVGEVPRMLVDRSGRRQFLCAAWPGRLLHEALARIHPHEGASLKSLYRVAEEIAGECELVASDSESADLDTPEDLARVRQIVDTKT
ncbi:NTP transferase domain-containing protein [Dermabacteraceae bacterium TAE3-ERU27]|nr:NTP transferase domain-containing protein [Dermabacteraceae bacterium TAE3-ERU27]